jgi:putative acetyltransferase
MLLIRQIQAGEVEAARHVIEEVCFEFFGLAPAEFDDMDDIERYYSGDAGTFLVLVDDARVVGTGAIRRLDNSTCELKRMWFLKEYRGRGLGKEMALLLLEDARQKGYQLVRLDTAPELERAIKLYQSLGFSSIERYNDGPCTLFMEKLL